MGQDSVSYEQYRIVIAAEDERSSSEEAKKLADDLREVRGVTEANRRKGEDATMDLGAIVTVLARSGATVALARGIADWIRGTRMTRITIEKDPKAGSIKAIVENIDPEAAVRITELIRTA